MYYGAIRPQRPPGYEYPFNGVGLGILDLSTLTAPLSTGPSALPNITQPAPGTTLSQTAAASSSSDGTCPAGWTVVTDTNKKPRGCLLPAYPVRIAGQGCSAEMPEVFDAQGKSVGCLTQAYLEYTPMLAAVDENGNVVDQAGNQITYAEDSAFSKHPYMTVALAALAAVGAAMVVSRALVGNRGAHG